MNVCHLMDFKAIWYTLHGATIKKMAFSNLIFPYQSLIISYHIISHHIISYIIPYIISDHIRLDQVTDNIHIVYFVYGHIECQIQSYHLFRQTIISLRSVSHTSPGIQGNSMLIYWVFLVFFFHIKFVGLSVYSFLALWSSITARISHHPYNSKWITRVLLSMSYNHMISAIFQLHIFGIIDIWSKLFIHFIWTNSH